MYMFETPAFCRREEELVLDLRAESKLNGEILKYLIFKHFLHERSLIFVYKEVSLCDLNLCYESAAATDIMI
jgi:hypothetical protein